MKFYISIGFIFILTQVFVPKGYTATFADTQGTYFQTAYTYLSNKSIVQGYSDGTGRPYAPINRVEALKVIVAGQVNMQERLQFFQRELPPLPLFSDVSQSQWYAPYLEVAFENKIITGYSDGTFKPNNSVTVEEAIAMIIRTYNVTNTSLSYSLSPYIQNSDGQWFTPFINTAISKNLISPQFKLFLGKPITRGQFFDILYRIDSIIASGEQVYAASSQAVAVVSPATSASTPSSYVLPSTAVSHTTTPITAQPSTNSQYASAKSFAISIPNVGINDLTITRPIDYTADGLLQPLQNGVGHLFSFPGGGGKVMIYGHSSGYPWDTSQYTKIFRKINETKPGDLIYITYNGAVYKYQVTFEETIPAADTSRFVDNGEGESLILYTCWPPDSITQRYLVHAVPVS